ncbi:MAG: hypothetical protein IPJ03_15170 [Ignavibacteriales bacterium]|nr:hypothetical protein [Ignavibacteriales bacterium]
MGIKNSTIKLENLNNSKNKLTKGIKMSSDQIKYLSEKAINLFSKRITDEVFLMIENDRELLQEYLRLVSDTKWDTVNQTIGKMVKQRYQLTNADRNYKPKSKLIKSHQKF